MKPKLRKVTLLDVVSELTEKTVYTGPLPDGVSRVDSVTPEAIRVTFTGRVDRRLLCSIAVEEGFTVDAGSYPPRIVDNGHIVARVGSRSDPGGDRTVYIYLFPASSKLMNPYIEVTAVRYGILDPATKQVDLGKLLDCNLKIVGLVEKYRRRHRSIEKRGDPVE